MFAKVVWPVLIALAVALIEPDHGRRRLMNWCCGAGTLARACLLLPLLLHAHSARIEGGHTSYSSEPYLPLNAGVA